MHLDAGVVGADRALDEFLRLRADFLAALFEHEVEAALADDLADRAFADLAERLFRIAHVECELDGIGAPVLHREVDVHHRLVLGQHAGAVGEAAELRDVHDRAAVDRPRQAHVEAAARRADVLAEARDDRALGRAVQVEAAEQHPRRRRGPRRRSRCRSHGRRCSSGRRPPPPPAPPNSPRSFFWRRRRISSRSGGPLSGRRCQGFSFLPGSFQAICCARGCSGDQAAELAASRGNSTKPAAGKQGETAEAKSTPASLQSASSSWCEDSTMRRVSPSARASSARTRRSS